MLFPRSRIPELTRLGYRGVKCGTLFFRSPIRSEVYCIERCRAAWLRWNRQMLGYNAATMAVLYVLIVLHGLVHEKNYGIGMAIIALMTCLFIFGIVAVIRFIISARIKSASQNAVLSGVLMDKRYIYRGGIAARQLLVNITGSDMITEVICCKEDYDAATAGCNILIINAGKGYYVGSPVDYR